MKIVTNTEIRDKFNIGFIRQVQPIEIVIHGTGGGASADALINWMLTGERGKDYKKCVGLFHYLNDFDGTITEIISPDRWVYHSTSGAHDALTIGIENMNSSPSNVNPYTDEQYKSLFALIDKLMSDYPIKSIVGHGWNQLHYSNSDKKCPGNFDWEILGEHLASKGITYAYTPRKYTMA
jgi:hypothetical protein